MPSTVASAASYGLPVVVGAEVPVSLDFLRLITTGIGTLWQRIVAEDPRAEQRPLILSYDVHPAAGGPVLIEVNANAGGILTAIEAARVANAACDRSLHDWSEQRLLALFKRDLLGLDRAHTGLVAVVDDAIAAQPLFAEMQALARLLRPWARDVLLVDAADLSYSAGRLRHGDVAIDRVYWRSTDFLLTHPAHEPIRRAVAEGTTIIAPTPQAYRAIADKRRFVGWSSHTELSHDQATGATFRLAETQPLFSRPLAQWYADRARWVFKPSSSHASRGVYVGKSISRQKLAELPAEVYLAQRYAPHPVLHANGETWKYDLRFFADRGQVIAAAARVFRGQVLGMRVPGSGYAPIRFESCCCLAEALAAQSREVLAPPALCPSSSH